MNDKELIERAPRPDIEAENVLIPDMVELLDLLRFAHYEGRELHGKELEVSNRIDAVLLKYETLKFPDLLSGEKG